MGLKVGKRLCWNTNTSGSECLCYFSIMVGKCNGNCQIPKQVVSALIERSEVTALQYYASSYLLATSVVPDGHGIRKVQCEFEHFQKRRQHGWKSALEFLLNPHHFGPGTLGIYLGWLWTPGRHRRFFRWPELLCCFVHLAKLWLPVMF